MSRVDFLTPFLAAARGSVSIAGPLRGNGLEHLLEILDAASGMPIPIGQLVSETGLPDGSVEAIVDALERINAVTVERSSDNDRPIAVAMPIVSSAATS